MRIQRALVVLALAASPLLCAVARAEETLDELKAKLGKQWEPWKGCGAGSWYQTRSRTTTGGSDSVTEVRQTLVARDEKSLTIETRIVTRKKDEQGNEAEELGEPTRSTVPVAPEIGYENLKDLPRETVEVDGRKLDCRVVELEYVYKYPQPIAGKTEMRSKLTMWLSEEVREFGGVVKTEGDSDNQPMLGNSSFDMKLVAVDKETKVGGKTVKCAVFHYGNASGKEELTTSGDVWMSAEVPFGYVRTAMTMNYKSGTQVTHMAMESEVTGFEIVRPKQE